MTFAELVKQKKANAIRLVNEHGLLKTNKALGVVKIADKKVLKKLLKGLAILPTNFIVVTQDDISNDSNNIVFTTEDDFLDSGVDFMICDDSIGGISGCFEKGIATIILRDSSMNSLLTEFDPMKNIGNAYLYDSLNEWSIFSTLIRYLENYKFSFDNKNLVKNIFES